MVLDSVNSTEGKQGFPSETVQSSSVPNDLLGTIIINKIIVSFVDELLNSVPFRSSATISHSAVCSSVCVVEEFSSLLVLVVGRKSK